MTSSRGECKPDEAGVGPGAWNKLGCASSAFVAGGFAAGAGAGVAGAAPNSPAPEAAADAVGVEGPNKAAPPATLGAAAVGAPNRPPLVAAAEAAGPPPNMDGAAVLADDAAPPNEKPPMAAAQAAELASVHSTTQHGAQLGCMTCQQLSLPAGKQVQSKDIIGALLTTCPSLDPCTALSPGVLAAEAAAGGPWAGVLVGRAAAAPPKLNPPDAGAA